MTAAVCAVGPVTLARVPGGAVAADPMLVCAAMDGGDGRFVLVGDDPVPLGEVWVDCLRPVLDGADRALLIHPSWWTAPRIDTVRAATTELVSQVDLRSRSAVLASRHPAATVVEVAVNVVLVMRGGVAVSAHERSSAPQELASSVADSVRSSGPGPAVVIDAPAQVPGAEVLAALISAALPGTGVVISGDRQLGWAAAALVARGRSETVHERGVTRRWPATVSAVGLTLAALAPSLPEWCWPPPTGRPCPRNRR